MKSLQIVRSVLAFAIAAGAVLAPAACASGQSAVADQAQPAGANQVQPTTDGQVASAAADHVMVNPADLKWTDLPSLPPGGKVAVIEGQLDQPVPFTLRLQFPADYRIPAHRHPAVEHVTVLSGAINMGMGDALDKARSTALPTGSFVIVPAGTNHFLWTAEGATVQVHGMGPIGITYANPADDPRTK